MTAVPSRSALMAAAARAAHLEVDRPPFLFEDTLARQLLGDQGEEPLSYQRTAGAHPILARTRLVTTARAHYAEQRLMVAVERGVRQYVILGAGLDSFAYRSPLQDLAVYEVERPETSAWKQDRLAAAGIRVPPQAHLVPLDLGRELLLPGLKSHGFDASSPAFVSWLGVTMYLESPAIIAILHEVGELAPGSELVFDHALPAEQRDSEGAEYAALAESIGATNGEPWVTTLTAAQAEAMAVQSGLEVLAQPFLEDWVDPALWHRQDDLRPSRLWAMVHARVASR